MMKGQGVILNNIVPKSSMKIIAEKPCMQLVAATYKLLVENFSEIRTILPIVALHIILLGFGLDLDREQYCFQSHTASVLRFHGFNVINIILPHHSLCTVIYFAPR